MQFQSENLGSEPNRTVAENKELAEVALNEKIAELEKAGYKISANFIKQARDGYNRFFFKIYYEQQ